MISFFLCVRKNMKSFDMTYTCSKIEQEKGKEKTACQVAEFACVHSLRRKTCLRLFGKLCRRVDVERTAV